MAHQWFGNAVTAAAWRDIWLHEGFACYAEWLWSEEIGGKSVADRARHHYDKLASGHDQPTSLADPTTPHMFDDWVYKRGALTLHAVRACLGDDAFFRMLQSWTATHAGGIVTTKMFVDHCIEFASDDGFELAATLDAWLNQPRLPGLPVLRR